MIQFIEIIAKQAIVSESAKNITQNLMIP